jgi:hypothetical protein
MTFEIGKLYKCVPDRFSFPDDRAPGRTDIIHIPQSEKQAILASDDVLMVLEMLYIDRSRIRNSIRYNRWHMKIMQNDVIGYISLWEDDWEIIDG